MVYLSEMEKMLEAASIMMDMAASKVDDDGYFRNEIQRRARQPRIRKRKSYENEEVENGGIVIRDQAVPKPPRKRAKLREIKLRTTPEMTPELREQIRAMGGYEVELVFQKQMHETDLNKNHGRLSVPIKKLRYDFATEEEVKLLDEHDEKMNKKGMNVTILDPVLRESVICLKKWKIGSRQVYCLMTTWNSFVEANGFKKGEVVQLWSFRKDGFDAANQTYKPHHLCFAIANPPISHFL